MYVRICLGYGPECDIDECWCISNGGSSCNFPLNGICYPDKCYDKEDCHGNGYWCNDTG